MNWKRKLLALGGVAVLGLGLAGTSLADTTDNADISITVNEAPLTVAVTAGAFNAVDNQLSTESVGTFTIEVTDGRSFLDGWFVQASVSAFTGTGVTPPTFEADIDLPTVSINPAGPSAPGLVTLLSNPGDAVTVLTLLDTNYGGNSAWSATHDALAFVPSGTVPDTYTSTITVNIFAGSEP